MTSASPSRSLEEPLTIALVIDDSLDRADGVQQNVLTLGRWLTEQGHDVHYIASHTSRTDLPNVHDVAGSLPVRFNGNLLRTPLPARARDLRTLLDSVTFDVVHVQMPYSPLLAGRVVSRIPPRTALLGTFHILPGSPVVGWGIRALGLVQHRQLRRFDTLIGVSQPTADYVTRTLRRPAVAVANPVPTAHFLHDPAPVPPADPAASVGSAARPARIGFLGRLVPRKGPKHLFEAIAQLERTTDLHLELTLGGDGPQRAELEAFARTLRTPVTFLGQIAEEKVDLLAGSDVVALPSVEGESFGIVLVEALACATGPVIAGDNAGYRSVMEPFPDHLVDPADTAAFARLLERAIRAQDARADIVERQRAHALTFDTDRVCRQIVALYRAALDARRRA